jgi:hypothetical protein
MLSVKGNRLSTENWHRASRLPLTVLVDADGRVLKKIYGARAWDSPQALQLIAATFGTNAHRADDEPTRSTSPWPAEASGVR